MKAVKINDWIFWSSKENKKVGEEPERVVDVRKLMITERKRVREAVLITTDRGSSAYEHNTFFRYATEEEIKEMQLKYLFDEKKRKYEMDFLRANEGMRSVFLRRQSV